MQKSFSNSTLTYRTTSLKCIFLIALLFVATHIAFAQNGTVRGIVKDKKTEVPLIGATVILQGTSFGAVVDTNGRFLVQNIPSGSYNIKVEALGYDPDVLYNIVLSSGNDQILTIEMENAKSVNLSEITIKTNPFAHSTETPLSIQPLSAQEIKSNPGGNFDISRVVQGFPGVGGTSGSVGGIGTTLSSAAGLPTRMCIT